uniref:Wsv433-like protein n=1 Tax=Pasiphaea japonica whispovirus TaxID=2984286 RepID=A0A9C7F7H8_9VIRU|nr:MAG: wsv433-like protein [Pasiphaea japonica whispovirus]
MASSCHYFKGLDDLVNNVLAKNKNDTTQTNEKKKIYEKKKIISPTIHPTPQLPETNPKPAATTQPPTQINKNHKNLTVEQKVKTSELRIKNALAEIVCAAKERSEALTINTARNTSYDAKDSVFSVLKSSFVSSLPMAVIGNNVCKASKKNEINTAVKELDIKKKCALVYDETVCLNFWKKHHNTLLQMATQYFSRHDNTKCNGINVCVKGDENNNYRNKLLVKNLPNSNCDISVLEVNGVRRNVIERSFASIKNSCEHFSRKPSERINLDTTKAEASHVFSTLHRLDPKRKLFFAGKTFYQKKTTFNNKFRWMEVVGWDENEVSKQAVKVIKPTIDDVFILPNSFHNVAEHLKDKYGYCLYKKSSKITKRKYYNISPKLINPQLDSVNEYKEIIEEINNCLNVLLSLGKNSTYTQSTLNLYNGKFKRYVIFCFALYSLNKDKHAESVSPLPFNFLNLFSYMYCHGPKLHSTSFLATLTFIQNYLFYPMTTAAPAVSAKRLLDIDSSIMKGGKGVGVRDFGSPVKTSLHTRTLVSFLSYAEMAMGTMTALLTANYHNKHLSVTLAERIANSLDRWCDAIIFVFFTFVLFHRFSGVKKVSLDSALRLILGQTHAHTNKVRASKRCRNEQEGEEACLTLSHAHLLGLPYSIQFAIGLPVRKLHPLVKPSNTTAVFGNLVHISNCLKYEFPKNGYVAGNLSMFDNLIKEIIDEYYSKGSFENIISQTKEVMENNSPYDRQSGLLLVPSHIDDRDTVTGDVSEKYQQYLLHRDVEDYLMASPMKMVFIRAIDNQNKEKYLSVGDLAVLAIWCKKYVLCKNWEDPVISKSQYEWLSSKLCGHLLLADLVNFGLLGDLKIINRLDTNTNTFHRDTERLPTASDQKKFIKNTSLDDRKKLAFVHHCINIRTRTHLGRVTATSWAVDAIRTLTKGDKDTFATLSASLDLHHLGHTNSANFVPYFSNNYVSNEQEIGLWGYVRRTSEKVAKNELNKGNLGNLDKVGIANSNLAAAAIAISSAIDLGETQAVLDDSAKFKKVSSTSLCLNTSKVSQAREREREACVQRLLVPNKKTQNKQNVFLLKQLWGFFADPEKRKSLIDGKAISAMCMYTGFLHAAVPDFIFHYDFKKPSSFIRLRLRYIQNEPTCKTSNYPPPPNKKRRLVKDKEDAVLTLDDKDNIIIFDKFALADTDEARCRMKEQHQRTLIAGRIKKACERKHRKRIEQDIDQSNEDAAGEELIEQLTRVSYL